MTISREQTARYLYDAGFRGDDLTRMVAIAGRESSYDPAAHRSDQPKSKLSGDMGLFQINYTNWPKVAAALGLTDKSQLFDPAINAKAAKVLFDDGGYEPWGMGSNGWAAGGDPMKGTDYQAAQKATSAFLANPSAYGGNVTATATATADRTQPTLYRMPSGEGEGSFIGFIRYPTGEMDRLTGEEWNGFTSTMQPVDIDQAKFAEIVKTSKPRNEAPAGYLSAENQALWDQTRATAAAPAPPTNPNTGLPSSPEITNLLKRFGVSYENAPPATPALLAFMRGIGLTQDTADDSRSTALARLASNRTEADTTLTRNAESQKKVVTGDLVRRGVIQAGEANTRFSEHEADVGERRTRLQNAYGEGVENVETAYRSTTDSLRQQALERVLNTETTQAQEAAASRAQTDALKAQTDAADLAWRRSQEASEAANQWQIDFLRNNPGAA